MHNASVAMRPSVSAVTLACKAATACRPLRDYRRKVVPIAFAAALVGTLLPHSVQAQSTGVVALGASNTAGKGVGASSAWPAQLEVMLRAKGYDVRFTNAGISGDDTGRMRARLESAVAAGTKIVILEKAASNDRKRGVDTVGNIAAMTQTLNARGIKTIVIPGMHGWADRQLQDDGVHITVAGHSAVATRLLPLVAAAIGKRK